MYYLLESLKNQTHIRGVCEDHKLKTGLLNQVLKKNGIKYVKHIENVEETGTYCVQNDTNINKYDIISVEMFDAGYIYNASIKCEYQFNYEFVYYKPSEEEKVYKEVKMDIVNGEPRLLKPILTPSSKKVTFDNKIKTL